MAKTIKIIHDPVGETITVYSDNPENAETCEETGEGVDRGIDWFYLQTTVKF